MRLGIALLTLLGLLSACSTTSPNRPAPATPVRISSEPRNPASLPLTETAPTAETPRAIEDSPLPVYRGPKIVRVHVDAYINGKGEAFPDTEKYVFIDEGGWNIGALRHPERAYIPEENVLAPQSAPGVLWGSVAPGDVPQPGPASSTPIRKLFDADQIRLTGYFNRSDEPKANRDAQRIAVKERRPVSVIYDESLGWIIVPQAALTPAIGVALSAPSAPAALQPASDHRAADTDIK